MEGASALSPSPPPQGDEEYPYSPFLFILCPDPGGPLPITPTITPATSGSGRGGGRGGPARGADGTPIHSKTQRRPIAA